LISTSGANRTGSICRRCGGSTTGVTTSVLQDTTNRALSAKLITKLIIKEKTMSEKKGLKRLKGINIIQDNSLIDVKQINLVSFRIYSLVDENGALISGPETIVNEFKEYFS